VSIVSTIGKFRRRQKNRRYILERYATAVRESLLGLVPGICKVLHTRYVHRENIQVFLDVIIALLHNLKTL